MNLMRPLLSFLSLTALLFTSAIVPPNTAHAQDNASSKRGKSIIILDASGSMWGEVPGGGVKIDAARTAVSGLLETLDPGIEIGLMAYGHRRKGDCEDIELLVEPGATNREAIRQSVLKITPRGKTPLSDAVLKAADALKYEEEKATVILVSDGIETCGKDPCAVGAQLAARGIDFVCHVVGFDLTEEQKKNIKCLADKTGGLYLDAKDAASLKDSLEKAVETVAMPDTSLILSAKNKAGDLLDGVNFQIFEATSESDTPAYAGRGGKFRQSLKEGDYLVVATFGDLKAEGKIAVPKGETTSYELSFEASGLVATAKLQEDGEPIVSGLSWKIYDKPDSDSDRSPIAYSYQPQPTFNLSPGDYFLSVRKEETTVEKKVTVEDKQTEVTLVLGSGILVATAKMSENDPLIEKGLSWKLLSGPDIEGDRKQIANSYESKTNLIVPAGKYLLTVKHGSAYAEKEVEVKPGDTTETLLTFGAGVLKASATLVEGGEKIQKSLSWKLLSEPNSEGDRERVATSYADQPEFKVASGVYLLQLKRDAATVEETVAVKAGAPTEVTLNLNAGIWQGRAYMSEDKAEQSKKQLKWKVLTIADGEGNQETVKSGYEEEPAYCMPAGRYEVELGRGSAKVRKTIQVLPGQMTRDDVVLNAGTVAFKAPAGAKQVSWKIYNADADGAKGERLTSSYATEFKTYLPVGNGIAELEIRGEDKKTLEKKFQVEAGKFLELNLGE